MLNLYNSFLPVLSTDGKVYVALLRLDLIHTQVRQSIFSALSNDFTRISGELLCLYVDRFSKFLELRVCAKRASVLRTHS